jgi:hypothetical protein
MSCITNTEKFYLGNFSGPKAQEVVVAKGNFIELLRPDDTGKMQSILSTHAFSIIRSLLAFRLAGYFFVNLVKLFEFDVLNFLRFQQRLRRSRIRFWKNINN